MFVAVIALIFDDNSVSTDLVAVSIFVQGKTKDTGTGHAGVVSEKGFSVANLGCCFVALETVFEEGAAVCAAFG